MRSYSRFSDLLHELKPFLAAIPPGTDLVYPAWRRGESPSRDLFDAHGDVARHAFIRMRSALMALDGESQLVTDLGRGVRETVQLRLERGLPHLDVVNAIGEREKVTTWYATDGFEHAWRDWCDARHQSEDLGEPWDVARRERRVVDYQGERRLIDPGCNLALDLIVSAGCETHHSCEGHPGGGYVAFSGPHDVRTGVTNVFSDIGWRVEPSAESTVVRMPMATSVRERDRRWRRTCDMLSFYAPTESLGMRP